MTATTTRTRSHRLDQLRGAAIILMIWDHTAVFLIHQGLPDQLHDILRFQRLTITRASLPLFMIVAGALLARKPPTPHRLAQLAAAAVAVSVLITWSDTGLRTPEILGTLLPVMLAAPLIRRWPLPIAAAAAIQPTTWATPWAGYEPGILIVLLVLGMTFTDHLTGPTERRFPTVETIGQHPLTIYTAHTALLAALSLT